MGCPAASSAWVRPVAMALRTASPRADAICIDTLTIPDPRPASATGTSAMAIDSSGANAVPAPSPDEEERGEHDRDVAWCRCPSVVSNRRPSVPATIPGMRTRLSPNRVTSRAVTPADRMPMVTDMGRKASPVWTGVKPRTPSR